MKKFTLLLAGIALLGACKKDSENAPSKLDLLTARNWRVTAITTASTTGTSTITTDDYANLKPCEKDNFFKFNTNKSLIVDEGASRCNTNDPQTLTLAWDFNSDQTKLLVTGQGSTSSNELVELSSSTLRIRESSTYTSSGGSTVTETQNVTFTAF